MWSIVKHVLNGVEQNGNGMGEDRWLSFSVNPLSKM